jgi:hypothetical protein
MIIIVIFITGLHKKHQGCGASVASAAGPFTTKKKTMRIQLQYKYSTHTNTIQLHDELITECVPAQHQGLLLFQKIKNAFLHGSLNFRDVCCPSLAACSKPQ